MKSILALIPPNSSRMAYTRFFRSVLHLGAQLRVNTHILAPSAEIQKLQEQAGSGHGAMTFRNAGELVFHPLKGDVVEQVLKAIDEYSCELILLENRSEPAWTERTSLIGQIFEKAPGPVFVVPATIDFGSQPIRSFLVPLSGEERASGALAFALTLAEQLRTPVDLMHVTTHDRPEPVVRALESVGDEFQHEYLELMERIVSEVCPYSNVHQRSFLRRFYYSFGDTSEELSKVLKSCPGGVIVMEWKGTFERGHAEIIRALIRRRKFPLLLLKVERQVKSTLKTGPEFHAA